MPAITSLLPPSICSSPRPGPTCLPVHRTFAHARAALPCAAPHRSAYVHGAPEITLAFALGALAYQLVQPHIPELGGGGGHLHHPDDDLDLDSDKVRCAGWLTLACSAGVLLCNARARLLLWVYACPAMESRADTC